MKIQINGENRETGAATVQALLEELEIKPQMVAVELNLKVISKCDYASATVSEGDQIEIVNFVGGG